MFYSVPTEIARQLLDGTGLVAVTLAGRSIINATWFDYGESSIGAYREFSLGVVASRETLHVSALASLLLGRAASFGSYILALPVDSEVARAGGVAWYGLPKTKVEFGLAWGSSKLNATISDQGQPILSMQVPIGLGIPCWIRELVIYSQLEGKTLRTPIATNWLAQIDLVCRPRLTVAQPEHSLGRFMTRLGLQSARPLAVVHGRLRYAQLPPPVHS